MSLSKYIYAGPSWAFGGFPLGADTTNLAQEWGFDHVNVSECAASVLKTLRKVKQELAEQSRPVVWIYHDPLTNLAEFANMSMKEFIQDSAWLEIRSKCNQAALAEINNIGVPVLLIGAHSDIVDCDFENITVGHASWQKFLAQQAGMTVTNGVIEVEPSDGGNYALSHCWGAEMVQRIIHRYSDIPEIKPTASLVDATWDIYFFWDELAKKDYFFEAHPTKRGNIEFAKFLKTTVENFLTTAPKEL